MGKHGPPGRREALRTAPAELQASPGPGKLGDRVFPQRTRQRPQLPPPSNPSGGRSSTSQLAAPAPGLFHSTHSLAPGPQPRGGPGVLGRGPRLSLLSMMFCSRVWGSWATAWSRYWRSLLMLDTGMPKDCTNSSSCWGSRSCRAEGGSHSGTAAGDPGPRGLAGPRAQRAAPSVAGGSSGPPPCILRLQASPALPPAQSQGSPKRVLLCFPSQPTLQPSHPPNCPACHPRWIPR